MIENRWNEWLETDSYFIAPGSVRDTNIPATLCLIIITTIRDVYVVGRPKESTIADCDDDNHITIIFFLSDVVGIRDSTDYIFRSDYSHSACAPTPQMTQDDNRD